LLSGLFSFFTGALNPGTSSTLAGGRLPQRPQSEQKNEATKWELGRSSPCNLQSFTKATPSWMSGGVFAVGWSLSSSSILNFALCLACSFWHLPYPKIYASPGWVSVFSTPNTHLFWRTSCHRGLEALSTFLYFNLLRQPEEKLNDDRSIPRAMPTCLTDRLNLEIELYIYPFRPTTTNLAHKSQVQHHR
jgi:hypothetical protein